MKCIFCVAALFSFFALLAICIFLFAKGFPSFAQTGFFKFIFGKVWNPVSQTPTFGILPMILGSIYVTALATIIGVTIGLFTSIFLFKFCPKKLVPYVRQLVNLLAGIPSVIYGLFGLTLIVPLLASISPTAQGEGILAASIILSIMILPTIVSISLNALYAVPTNIYEGALALGSTKEQTVFKAVVPAAKNGIFAAIVLAIGRAIGETMAVTMVVGNNPNIPKGIFQPINTLTSVIAGEALEHTSESHMNALIAIGVVLFVFTLLLNITFMILKNRKKNTKSKISKIISSRFEQFSLGYNKGFNKFKKGLSYVCAILAILALGGIICYILISGIPHIDKNFLFGKYSSKEPTLSHALIGTLYLIGISIAIAAPIGIASAIFLSEYAAKTKIVKYIRLAVETLAAIPSIVYGLFGYLIFVVFLGFGFSLLGGGITLAIMILPMIIRTTEESLLSVPISYREGSFALGASKVRTTFKVILPCAAGGIVSSLILSIGRVVSESAVLILTIGMVSNLMPSSMMSAGTSMALDVFYLGSHGNPQKAAAMGVILLILVVGLNLLATFIGKLLKKGESI